MGEFRTEIGIAATPETVYAYFLDPARMVRWMGDRARLEAREGGEFSVDINGVLIRGHYVDLSPPHRIEIAWGQLGNAEMPPGTTRVVVELEATTLGTKLRLTHTGLVEEEATKHSLGWPHFLARMAIAAAGGDPGRDPFSIRTAEARRYAAILPMASPDQTGDGVRSAVTTVAIGPHSGLDEPGTRTPFNLGPSGSPSCS